MAVWVEFNKAKARIDRYRWSGSDQALVSMLNAMLDPYGPISSDPDPDATAAQSAADLFGGRVVQADPISPRRSGVIY